MILKFHCFFHDKGRNILTIRFFNSIAILMYGTLRINLLNNWFLTYNAFLFELNLTISEKIKKNVSIRQCPTVDYQFSITTGPFEVVRKKDVASFFTLLMCNCCWCICRWNFYITVIQDNFHIFCIFRCPTLILLIFLQLMA